MVCPAIDAVGGYDVKGFDKLARRFRLREEAGEEDESGLGVGLPLIDNISLLSSPAVVTAATAFVGLDATTTLLILALSV